MIDAERSYRATLLGLRHGVDLARLLHEVAMRGDDPALRELTRRICTEREVLLANAVDTLRWFAEQPRLALTSGLRLPVRAPTPAARR